MRRVGSSVKTVWTARTNSKLIGYSSVGCSVMTDPIPSQNYQVPYAGLSLPSPLRLNDRVDAVHVHEHAVVNNSFAANPLPTGHGGRPRVCNLTEMTSLHDTTWDALVTSDASLQRAAEVITSRLPATPPPSRTNRRHQNEVKKMLAVVY